MLIPAFFHIIIFAGTCAHVVDNTNYRECRERQHTMTVMRPNGEYPMGFKMDVEKHKGKIYMEKNEIGLLATLLAWIQLRDPDAIIGHKF